MTLFKFLSLACASSFLRQVASDETLKVALGDATDVCLAEINAARKDAGFTGFTSASKFSTPSSPDEFWKSVCSNTFLSTATGAEEATYGVMALYEQSKPVCKDVVKYWQSATQNFSSRPPAKAADDKIYSKNLNVSLLALYNPGEKPEADCRVATCTKETTEITATEEGKADGDFTHYVVICKTTPKVGLEKPPFTESQWEAITKAVTSSAQTAVPAFLALLAVAAGVAFF